jgi:hypothetical protein
MARHRTDQEWASIVGAYRRSGLSQVAFCRRRGLALSTFRLRLAAAGGDAPAPPSFGGAAPRERQPPALLEIPVTAPRPGALPGGPGHAIPVELEFPGGVRASLAVPPEMLAGLLAGLHRLPRP